MSKPKNAVMAATYIKRSGTGAVQGQLYETKLISLILFRLLHNADIVQFHLATNYDGIGAFDDICFRAETRSRDRPLLVFLQAKHKENDKTYLEYDLIKHFYQSYVMVKEKFSLKKCNPKSQSFGLFSGVFNDIDCVFVLYTNAYYDRGSSDTKESYKTDILSNLLQTGDEESRIFKLGNNNEDIQILNEKVLEEKFANLAEHLTKFLNDKSMNILQDEYVKKYHVILARHIFNISDVKTEGTNEWRTLKFKSDFFNTNDIVLSILRKKIYEHISLINKSVVNKRKKKGNAHKNGTLSDSNEVTLEQNISLFLLQPSAITLSPLIDTHIIYENNELKFIDTRSDSDVNKLKEIGASQSLVDEAKSLAVEKILRALELKVPTTFGNIDLKIGGKDKIKINNRLIFLLDKIEKLCERAKLNDSYKVVVVEEGDGFSNFNGDIGGVVGNLLVHDVATNCFKFTEQSESLENNARFLFNQLNGKINDLGAYRFHMKNVIHYPTLVFDYSNEVKGILNNVLVFERQSNHNGVENTLIKEIAHQQSNDLAKPDENIIFLYYHNKVQEWWIKKVDSSFQTKTNNSYQETICNIVGEPQMSALHNMYYMNNLKYFKYDFTHDVMRTLKSLEEYRTIILATNISTLTTMKVLRGLRNIYNRTYSVLDFECVLKLVENDFCALTVELKHTNKVIVLVCNNTESSRTLHRRLDNLTETTSDKSVIVVTDHKFYKTVDEYFVRADVVIIDKMQSLTDLTLESMRDVIQQVKVIFQGKEVDLKKLMDDQTAVFVKGDVLNKVLRNDSVVIGKSLVDAKYEEIKHLYIDRRIMQASNGKTVSHLINTFHDINEDVVLLTSTAGMGKSTLLTHLTLTTKDKEEAFWIVRLNLLDHADVFRQWLKENTIDNLKIFHFLTKITLLNNKVILCLKEFGSKMYVTDFKGDDETAFEINIFLHLYNERKVIFLFDGFDEICPNYKDSVIKFIYVVKNNYRYNKLWVTSRPYSDILPDLEHVLGKSHVLEHIDNERQKRYLEKFWQHNLKLDGCSEDKIKCITDWLESIGTELMRVPRNDHIYSMSEYMCDYLKTRRVGVHDDMFLMPRVSSNNFLGAPLVLYVLADYFVHLVINFDLTNYKLGVNISLYTIYEQFVETKLKKIFFGDKMKVNTSMPYLNTIYKNELNACISRYKNLGAYAILKDVMFHEGCRLDEFKDMPFNKESTKEIEAEIRSIETGKDTTGLISYVTADNLPMFIHRTFAEYFANEFICDILKSDKYDTHSKKLVYSIMYLYSIPIFSYWMSNKRIYDQELDSNIKALKAGQSDNIINYYADVFNMYSKDRTPPFTMEQNIRICSSSVNDYESDIVEFLDFTETSIIRKNKFVKDNYRNEFLARMRPHLKRYFPTAPPSWTPLHVFKELALTYVSTDK